MFNQLKKKTTQTRSKILHELFYVKFLIWHASLLNGKLFKDGKYKYIHLYKKTNFHLENKT